MKTAFSCGWILKDIDSKRLCNLILFTDIWISIEILALALENNIVYFSFTMSQIEMKQEICYQHNKLNQEWFTKIYESFTEIFSTPTNNALLSEIVKFAEQWKTVLKKANVEWMIPWNQTSSSYIYSPLLDRRHDNFVRVLEDHVLSTQLTDN